MRAFLFPFAILYGFIVWIRNRMFDYGMLQSHDYRIPIIGVGNITVGGTGKTPHVEYLIRLLNKTHSVAVISRGYKRETSGIIEASEQSTGKQIGDEPKQIKQKFPEASVIVSASRVKAINKIIAGQIGNNPDVVILDDAFQHRHVKPGLSILLIDYNRPIYEDNMLPYGNLRESAAEKNRADIVIVTKSPIDLKPIERRIISKNLNLYPYQILLFSYLHYGELAPLYNAIGDITLEECKLNNFSVLLLTGIANPAPLKNHIANYCSDVLELQYPDHFRYGEKDIIKIKSVYDKMEAQNKIIITTEKDAVRLKDVKNMEDKMLPLFYIPIEIAFLDNSAEEFDKKIKSFVHTNRKQDSLNR
jgi:tetraacyldisaccharide 4'-kinase